MSRKDFDTPHQIKGKPAQSRFGLRRAPYQDQPVNASGTTKPPKAPGIYASPGKGVQGESSN